MRALCLNLLHLLAALITGACIAAMTGAIAGLLSLTHAIDQVVLWFGIGVVLALGAIVLLALYERRA